MAGGCCYNDWHGSFLGGFGAIFPAHNLRMSETKIEGWTWGSVDNFERTGLSNIVFCDGSVRGFKRDYNQENWDTGNDMGSAIKFELK